MIRWIFCARAIASSRRTCALARRGQGVLGPADGAVGQVVGGLDLLPAQPQGHRVGHRLADPGRDGVGVGAEAVGQVRDRVGGRAGRGDRRQLLEQGLGRGDVVGELLQLGGQVLADERLEAVDLELAGTGVELRTSFSAWLSRASSALASRTVAFPTSIEPSTPPKARITTPIRMANFTASGRLANHPARRGARRGEGSGGHGTVLEKCGSRTCDSVIVVTPGTECAPLCPMADPIVMYSPGQRFHPP